MSEETPYSSCATEALSLSTRFYFLNCTLTATQNNSTSNLCIAGIGAKTKLHQTQPLKTLDPEDGRRWQ